MKIWYFRYSDNCDYVVAFGETPQDAWENFLKSRQGQGCLDYIETDMSYWTYEEFNSETYGGALLFY